MPKPTADELRTALTAVTRNSLGRFVRLETLRTCNDQLCSDARTFPDAIEQHDAFLETLEQLVNTTDPAEVAELAHVIRDYRIVLRADAETVEDDRLDIDRRTPRWVEGRGVVEAMDVTGLSGREASTLALMLNQWNPGRRTKRYVWRGGRRYMAPRQGGRVDLNHPVMDPHRDDILASMADARDRMEFEQDTGDVPTDEQIAAAAADRDPLPPLPRLKEARP